MPWYEYSTRVGSVPLPLVELRLWHGNRSVRVVALVDSGADSSLFDVRYAEELGLDRRDAEVEESVGASGTTFATYRWPTSPLEIQFEQERFPFRGSFIAFPADSDGMNLAGRADFFRTFVVQFWDVARLMNIDLSPDFARPPLVD